MTTKQCKKCQETLPYFSFYFRKDSGKYQNNCKNCYIKVIQERKINKMVKKRTKFNFICLHCQKQKGFSDFYLKDKNKIRYDSSCKECRKSESLQFYRKNIIQNENNKKFYNVNKNNIVNIHKNENCREKIEEKEWNIWRILYEKKNIKIELNIYSTDINTKIGQLLTESCKEAISIGRKASLLGCHGIYAKKWLEFQFSNNMNWDNYGILWNLDHVIPIDSFDLSLPEQQSLCFHWTNIRPILTEKIPEQSNIALNKVIKLHNKIIKKFLEPIILLK